GAEQGGTVLGSGMMYAQLEAGMVGMAEGEERELEVAFPADWRVTAMAGQTANVHLKVLQVSEAQVPEVDEAFIKSFGIRSGKLEQFRKEVRANLERELKGNLMTRLRVEVASKLVAAFAHIELPPRLIDNEARGLANAAAEQARQQGQDVKVMADEFMVQAR